MMEWEPVYRVAMLSFLIGIVFGAVVNKTNFCTMGAVSDWVNMGSKGRLRAWLSCLRYLTAPATGVVGDRRRGHHLGAGNL